MVTPSVTSVVRDFLSSLPDTSTRSAAEVAIAYRLARAIDTAAPGMAGNAKQLREIMEALEKRAPTGSDAVHDISERRRRRRGADRGAETAHPDGA